MTPAEKSQEFANELEGKSDEEILKIMQERFKTIKIHAPTLDENLRPEIQLFNEVCPKEAETKNLCGKCIHFVGFSNPEGSIFAYGVYDGFCDLK